MFVVVYGEGEDGVGFDWVEVFDGWLGRMIVEVCVVD